MKRDDVQIGAVYTAKVTNKVVEVRIDAESPPGGCGAGFVNRQPICGPEPHR